MPEVKSILDARPDMLEECAWVYRKGKTRIKGTALALAVMSGKTDVTEFLISKKASTQCLKEISDSLIAFEEDAPDKISRLNNFLLKVSAKKDKNSNKKPP